MGPSRTYRPSASDPWSAEALRRERQQAQERQEQQRQARQAAAAAARARAAAAAARKHAGHWSQQPGGATSLGFSPVRSGFHQLFSHSCCSFACRKHAELDGLVPFTLFLSQGFRLTPLPCSTTVSPCVLHLRSYPSSTCCPCALPGGHPAQPQP